MPAFWFCCLQASLPLKNASNGTGQFPRSPLAQLDPSEIEGDVRIAEAKAAAAQAEFSASEKTRDEAYQRFLNQQKLLEGGRAGTTTEDARGARLAYDRYVFEVKYKQAAVEVAKLEVQRAQRKLN